MCLPFAAAAQPFSFGVTAGAALTDPIEGSFGVRSEARRYIDPTAELRLPRSFAIEASALYRRIGYRNITGAFGITTDSRVRANSWEFPVLAKHYFGRGIRPFVAAGFQDNPTAGPVAAAGLSLRAGPLHLAPELRYTRWTGRPFNEEGSRGFFVRSTQNQLDVLFSLTF